MTQDRYKYFRVEAREILDQLGQGALDLEKGVDVATLVPKLLRLAHTLKGAARVVKQPAIADTVHTLEDVLTAVRDAGSLVSREHVGRVLSLLDTTSSLLEGLTPALPKSDARPAAAPPLPEITLRPEMEDLDALLASVTQSQVRLGALRPKLSDLARSRTSVSLVADQLRRSGRTDGDATGAGSRGDTTRSITETLGVALATLERDFSTGIEQLERELRHVRESAERLRLAPARALFTFLERAVRDAADTMGKRVAFLPTGGAVRVNPLVLNAVQGALLHVVRNAVAHGIEPEAARLALGKTPEGCVKLHVSQRGHFVSFTCADDGRGIDLEAVRAIAAQRGLALDGGREADSEELLRMLFAGGISTAAMLTNVSGRGIGLDAVRETAQRLGGHVTARTVAGQGTTIELVLPLSIASFRALVVEAHGESVVIPLDAVRGTMRVRQDAVVRTAQSESIVFEDHVIPLLSMAEAISAPANGDQQAPVSASVIVVQAAEGAAAFAVDRILGVEEVIMHPLPTLAPADEAIAGAALDAVGNPRLVVEPDALVAAAHRHAPHPGRALTPLRPILVVDDSLTTRMLEQSILESAGYTVELATSGEEGLEKARAGEHGLFLVDVEMPGIDGFTFVERTRADARLRSVPAILVTSRNAPEDKQRGKDAGAAGYMVKSEFDQDLLLAHIRRLMQ